MMLAALALFAVAPQVDARDLLFATHKLDCSEWARAANGYIDLGEAGGISALQDQISRRRNTRGNARVALILRILYVPKKGSLRPPKLGEYSLPPFRSSDWPDFPMIQQDGVWFCLDENVRPGGQPELAREYLSYCQEKGKFRTEKLAVPTRSDAEAALHAIFGSKPWNAIRWSGRDYTYDRGWTEEILQSETRIRPF